MGISVSHFGSNKPGPGVKPIKTQVSPKLPFGKPMPINWSTGKHVGLRKELPAVDASSVAGMVASQIGDNPSLSALAAFDPTALGEGGTMVWDGSRWVPSLFLLSSLGDVSVGSPADGDILVYDAANARWVTAAHTTALSDLSDVDLGVTEDGDVLSYDSESEKWIAADATPPEAEDPDTAVDTLGAGSEGTADANSDTWTAGGENGLRAWYVTRLFYDHAAAKILYAFLRMFVFDRFGRLYHVSGETRVEVDATVAET